MKKKKLSSGEMPHTDFHYEEFECFLTSYYITYLRFQVSRNENEKNGFKELEEALTKIARRHNVQLPQEVISNIRTTEAWAQPKVFPSKEHAASNLREFYRSYGIWHTSKEDVEDINRISDLILSPLFVF